MVLYDSLLKYTQDKSLLVIKKLLTKRSDTEWKSIYAGFKAANVYKANFVLSRKF